MGKYLSVIVGSAVLAVGVWGIVVTWPLLWKAVQATVPAMCVLGGLLAIFVGVSEIRDSGSSQATKPSAKSS